MVELAEQVVNYIIETELPQICKVDKDFSQIAGIPLLEIFTVLSLQILLTYAMKELPVASGKLSENGQKIAIFAEFPNQGQHHCHIITVECRIFAESLIDITMSLFASVMSMLYICIHNNNK